MSKIDYIKQTLNDFQKSDADVSSLFFDTVLGLENSGAIEKAVAKHNLRSLYGFEQFTYEATPYEYIRSFLNFLQPQKDDIVYDLGAGYGRVVIYSALVTKAKYIGIEIVDGRVESANKIIDKLKIKNAQMISGNVLDFDFSNGNIFFLFNPFYPETLHKVNERLKDIAKNKEIVIATWGGVSNDFFLDQDWLYEVEPEDSLETYYKLQFFKSR